MQPTIAGAAAAGAAEVCQSHHSPVQAGKFLVEPGKKIVCFFLKKSNDGECDKVFIFILSRKCLRTKRQKRERERGRSGREKSKR